jgi:[ribosomal protein S5]-alanine N-acetyltransferase
MFIVTDMDLVGERVTLRPWRKADAPSLVKYGNNPNIARQLRDRFPHPYTSADARHYIQSVADVRPTTSFAIATPGPAGEVIGGIGFSPGADVERFSAEIGYWLAEPFWGRGITAEAVTLVSAYAFETCNMLRLFALPFADNTRSTRVLEKAGYTREAILRASSVKHGVPRDQAIFALVNPAWRGV